MRKPSPIRSEISYPLLWHSVQGEIYQELTHARGLGTPRAYESFVFGILPFFTSFNTLNAAIQIFQFMRAGGTNPRLHDLRPLIINFASYKKPGGGWLNGAVAQEAICYRSSLAVSLDERDYPLALDEVIYTPSVVVLRDDMASGHRLLFPHTPAKNFPVVSTITLAAMYRPRVQTFVKDNHGNSGNSRPGSQWRKKQVFALDRHRNTTKDKMRLALRIAATHRHRLLVLGALGCGVYGNPPEDVAHCWLEVLKEDEFSGHWWMEVWFAVYDPSNEGNYATFGRVLSGKMV